MRLERILSRLTALLFRLEGASFLDRRHRALVLNELRALLARLCALLGGL